MAQPFHTFTEEKSQAAIWKNAKSDGSHYYTVSFSRRYQQDGDTKYTQSFGLHDLSHLVVLAGKSIAYIWKQVLKDRNPEALKAAEEADNRASA